MRGRVAYLPTYAQMQAFTATRDAQTEDQLWICEHPPVYTQGLAGKAEHVLQPGEIPVVSTNRGGQITYHGPGQRIAYVMLDLRRRSRDLRAFVHALEGWVIAAQASASIAATTCELKSQ